MINRNKDQSEYCQSTNQREEDQLIDRSRQKSQRATKTLPNNYIEVSDKSRDRRTKSLENALSIKHLKMAEAKYSIGHSRKPKGRIGVGGQPVVSQRMP